MFETTIKVRYVETDAMAVVHHSVYFNWFEVCRVDFLDQAGLPYVELERRGYSLPVTDAGCKYARPLRFGDTVKVGLKIAKLSDVGMRIEYDVVRQPDGIRVATGHTVHPLINRQGKIVRMPADLKAVFEKYRSGNKTA